MCIRDSIKPELAAACDDGAIETELPGGLLPEALASVEAIPEHEAPEPDAVSYTHLSNVSRPRSVDPRCAAARKTAVSPGEEEVALP